MEIKKLKQKMNLQQPRKTTKIKNETTTTTTIITITTTTNMKFQQPGIHVKSFVNSTRQH